MKILILGDRGTLGSDLFYFNSIFKKYDFIKLDNDLRWPSDNFKTSLLNTKFDIVFNCISSTNNSSSVFESVYFDLPLFLSKINNIKVLNISSDILNSEINQYDLHSEYFFYKNQVESIVKRGVFLNIRTSFIGLSKNKSNFIYKNFIKSSESNLVVGYDNLFWSGVTTLQIYKCIPEFITCVSHQKNIIHLSSNCISNYQLLLLIKYYFKFNHKLVRDKFKKTMSRCSKSDILVPSIEKQISDLSNLYLLSNKC